MLTKKSLARLSNFQECHLFSLLLKSFFLHWPHSNHPLKKYNCFKEQINSFPVCPGHLVSGSQMGGSGEAELQGERAGAICRLEKRCWLYCERPLLTFSLTSQTYETLCPEVWIMLICLMAF